MFDLTWFIPEGMAQLSALILVVVSFFTSMLTASLGIGGGTVLLAVMAQVLPAKAIVPVHGVVQLGSNTGRALIMLKDVNAQFLAYFLLGCVLGAVMGGQVVVSLPTDVLYLILGCFILITVWGANLLPSKVINNKTIVIGGGLTTLLSMLVGATGPLVIAMVKQLNMRPIELVATSAAGLVIQHSLKLVVFGLVGFAFSSYLALMCTMIATGFLGTVLGKRILLKTPPANFKYVLDILITMLALRLVYKGVQGLFFT